MRRSAVIFAFAFAWASQASATPLFNSDAIIDFDLAGPLSTVIDGGKSDDESRFTVNIGDDVVPVKVRTRGKSRLRVCAFPPLRLNFSKDGTAGTVFADQDKLKLVTHCNDKDKDAGNIYDEYLAYRVFNLLTDYSYRVRLANVRYFDSDGRREPQTRSGILIESDEELARRLDASIRELPGVVLSQLDVSHATLVYVFQYLIGNTDWSLVTATDDDVCCHNGDLFMIDDELVIVPYDFDLAGIVDASYAKPDPSLRIRTVRARLYRGYCTSEETLRASLHYVLDKRGEIEALVNSLPANSAKDRDKWNRYLEKFFAAADDPDKLLKTFARRCLG